MRRADFLHGLTASLIWAGISPALSTRAGAAQSDARPVRLTIPAARGGINDLAGRLVARHFGRFLPGKPSIEIVNDESGGVALANRFATAADTARLEFAILQRAVPQLAIQGDRTAKFDPLKLNWLGSLSSFSNDAYVLIVNARHPAKTVWNLAPPAPPALIGGDAPGSTNLTFALVARDALKLNIQVKDGFSGAAGMFFAMKDGDLDGQVIGLNSLIANQPELWQAKDVRACCNSAETHVIRSCRTCRSRVNTRVIAKRCDWSDLLKRLWLWRFPSLRRHPCRRTVPACCSAPSWR